MTAMETAKMIPPRPDLRAACAELMLAGSLALADIARANPSWNSEGAARQSEERLRKALESAREALSQ